MIQQKLGNLASFADEGRAIDRLSIEWYESSKRILNKKTQSGKEVVLKFLNEPPQLQQDDVLHADETTLIVVDIIACEAMTFKPSTMYEMAYVCYEIGNKHLPLYYQDDTILIPYDAPTFKMLQAAGFDPQVEQRKLQNQVKTSVAPHAHKGSSESLFSRILKLTTPTND